MLNYGEAAVLYDDELQREGNLLAQKIAESATKAQGNPRRHLVSSFDASLERQLELEAYSIARLGSISMLVKGLLRSARNANKSCDLAARARRDRFEAVRSMNAYIIQAVRTATGKRNGALAAWHPADMAGEILNALVERSGIDPAAIEDVIVGCVSQVGEQSFHIGRNAVLASKLPDTVPAVSIDRQCGSSQQALHFAAQAVMSGSQDVVVAAGVESMTRVPIGSPTALAVKAGLGGPWSERIRKRYGVEQFSQFTGAQMLADKYGLTREELDQFALRSHQRALAAIRTSAFATEIVPLALVSGGTHTVDEGIRFDASIEAIRSVKVLQEGGILTAANSSQISDGASGVLVANDRALRTYGLTALARIHQLTVTAGDPVIMLEEPIFATRRALEKCGMKLADIDLFEINEAFAPVPLAWLKALQADPDRLNVNGGAIALGHPLGATGTKLMATLVHALHTQRKQYGLQAMCEGGGLANVTVIEALG
jgi:acetyl-CoA C-acetyltransferase